MQKKTKSGIRCETLVQRIHRQRRPEAMDANVHRVFASNTRIAQLISACAPDGMM
jgi:hypothetical protein